MSSVTFNPFTENFDFVGASSQVSTACYFYFDGVSTLSLYVNNTVVQTWTSTGGTSGMMGMPMGLLLGLTYNA